MTVVSPTQWINVYQDENRQFMGGFYSTREKAIRAAANTLLFGSRKMKLVYRIKVTKREGR